MCAIAGIVSKRRPVDPGRVTRMVQVLSHRGPDGQGFFHTPFASVGMARLSILDLTTPGLCPVVWGPTTDATVVLVYNGEIYNYLELAEELGARGHRFRSRCDSEVLLHAYLEWGEECLERLNGMFAFAILDLARDLLFAARDRAGEKPFYYYEDQEEWLFASEIKGILTQTGALDINITNEFRAFEYVTGEETLFKGIRALLPGHALVLRGLRGDCRALRISQYWNLPDRVRTVERTVAVDELDGLLQEAVRLRLRSDVPWGLYLSGGMDSSLLAYLARPAVCFTCHFPYGPQYDELEYASAVARDVGSEHVVIRPTREDFEASLSDVLYHLDMPVGSFSMFPLYMLARGASRRVKIVLSGEGADELFAGYTRYLLPIHEQELYSHPAMSYYRPLLDYYYGRPLDRFARLLNRGLVSDDVVKAVIAKHFEQFNDLAHAMGYTDFKLMLVTLLHMEDRAAAAFGLENRSPFLDHRVIELAFSIPADLKIRNGTPKWILAEAAKRHVPPLILERKHKMGLIFPVNLWMGFSGPRGEFDRAEYNRLCMDRWREVYYRERRFARGVVGGGAR